MIFLYDKRRQQLVNLQHFEAITLDLPRKRINVFTSKTVKSNDPHFFEYETKREAQKVFDELLVQLLTIEV